MSYKIITCISNVKIILFYCIFSFSCNNNVNLISLCQLFHNCIEKGYLEWFINALINVLIA